MYRFPLLNSKTKITGDITLFLLKSYFISKNSGLNCIIMSLEEAVMWDKPFEQLSVTFSVFHLQWKSKQFYRYM